MNKTRTKFLFFLAGIAIAVPVGALVVSLTGQFLAYFQQGANPASIFRGHQLIVPEPDEAMWLPFQDYGGSEPSRIEQEEILAAYRDAWYALAQAHLTGDTSDLLTYWAGDAYRQAFQAVNPKVSVRQTDMGHKLKLTFFSDDGSVVAFNDREFTLQQIVAEDIHTLTASAAVIMTLDNGFWRIRSLTLSIA